MRENFAHGGGVHRYCALGLVESIKCTKHKHSLPFDHVKETIIAEWQKWTPSTIADGNLQSYALRVPPLKVGVYSGSNRKPWLRTRSTSPEDC